MFELLSTLPCDNKNNNKKKWMLSSAEVRPMIDAYLDAMVLESQSDSGCSDPDVNDFEEVALEGLTTQPAVSVPQPATENENSDSDEQREVDPRLAWCANDSDSESPVPKRRIVYVGSGSDSESPVPKARVLANTNNSNATPAVANKPALIYK